MSALLVVPIVLGIIGTIQQGLNKRMAEDWSLPAVVLANAVVFVALAGALFALSRVQPQLLPDLLRDEGLSRPRWWYVLPGVFGLLFILAAPWSIAELGALKVFVVLIVAQIVTSFVWDVAVEHIPPSPLRVAGSLITVVGAVLLALSE